MSPDTQLKIARPKQHASRRKAHACRPTFEESHFQWRNAESLGSPWLFLPMEGRAQVMPPNFGDDDEARYDLRLPEWFGQVPTLERGRFTIPRERFSQAAELATERLVWIDLFTEMDPTERCAGGCSTDRAKSCTFECSGVFPELGWSHHCEVELPGGSIELHSVLFEGHSYEGMFE